MKKMNKKGFTIVELTIVIAVIAILAAVLIPTFSGIVTKAQASAVQQEAAAIYKEAYALDMSDGSQDYMDNGNDIVANGITNATTATTIEDGKFVYAKPSETDKTIFTYRKGDYTAKYDGQKWTTEKN